MENSKSRWYGQLYVQVLIGIVIGAAIGHFEPQFGAKLQPFADGFIRLIKMLLAPIIFGTVVVGIAKMGSIKEVGRIGVKSLLYFEILSTIALVIGLVLAFSTGIGSGANIHLEQLSSADVNDIAQRGQHIAVTAIQGMIGRGGNRVLLFAHQVLIAATFFYLGWVGLDVLEITGSEVFPVTGITAKWAYLALIAGFAGLGITALTTLVHLLQASDPLAVRTHHIEEDV